jgi:hypothetical protein
MSWDAFDAYEKDAEARRQLVLEQQRHWDEGDG